ncbi:unnamed protein product [Trifolium pratense]|uniref:Uncharacterized protein n=1 Tax=Trifolium pratense TaxID=57577 RepID=A0ACB0LTQ6_TRIPR|nr:unnamed protein product [Trifolium pratense]
MQQIQRFLPTEYNLQPSISSKDILKAHPQQNLLEEHHLISKDQPSAKVAEQDCLIPNGISRSLYLQNSQSGVFKLQNSQSGASRFQNFQSEVANKIKDIDLQCGRLNKIKRRWTFSVGGWIKSKED